MNNLNNRYQNKRDHETFLQLKMHRKKTFDFASLYEIKSETETFDAASLIFSLLVSKHFNLCRFFGSIYSFSAKKYQ